MTSAKTPLAPPFPDWPRIPYVGVGCIVERNGRILLVREHRGLWSTPGGHLDFGESLAECAARETLEETGIVVSNVRFVAITNDLLTDVDKHYLTVWMRADSSSDDIFIGDGAEIAEAGWFAEKEIPRPLHRFFESLVCGRSMPSLPDELPETLGRLGLLLQTCSDSPLE